MTGKTNRGPEKIRKQFVIEDGNDTLEPSYTELKLEISIADNLMTFPYGSTIQQQRASRGAIVYGTFS